MAIITLQEAKNVLHVDGSDNDDLINSLIAALPDYIELQTGMSATDQASEPMVHTVQGFILTMWYYSDHADDIKLTRTINALLKCITLKARGTAAAVEGLSIMTTADIDDCTQCLED